MYTLLIVDDEERVRRGIKNCLDWAAYGFHHIHTAKDGKEGLSKLIEVQPDLVLTDIVMPDMNGLEFIETARKMEYQNPFIVVSGYADFEFAQKALHLGVSAYIVKPVRVQQVQEQVALCMEKIQPKEAAPAEEPTATHPLIQTAIAYMRENYAKDLSLNEVASYVALHPNYFSTLFTKHANESFSKHLIRIRMKQAAELLKNPTIKVFEAAQMVGYEDYRQFSKQFKNLMGQTPMEYRTTQSSLK